MINFTETDVLKYLWINGSRVGGKLSLPVSSMEDQSLREILASLLGHNLVVRFKKRKKSRYGITYEGIEFLVENEGIGNDEKLLLDYMKDSESSGPLLDLYPTQNLEFVIEVLKSQKESNIDQRCAVVDLGTYTDLGHSFLFNSTNYVLIDNQYNNDIKDAILRYIVERYRIQEHKRLHRESYDTEIKSGSGSSDFQKHWRITFYDDQGNTRNIHIIKADFVEEAEMIKEYLSQEFGGIRALLMKKTSRLNELRRYAELVVDDGYFLESDITLLDENLVQSLGFSKLTEGTLSSVRALAGGEIETYDAKLWYIMSPAL